MSDFEKGAGGGTENLEKEAGAGTENLEKESGTGTENLETKDSDGNENLETRAGDGAEKTEPVQGEGIKKGTENKIRLWPGLKPEDIEAYRNLKQSAAEEKPKAVPEESEETAGEKTQPSAEIKLEKPFAKKPEQAVDTTEQKMAKKQRTASVREAAPTTSIRDLSEPREKRQPRRPQREIVSTRMLYVILGILCVVLAVALVTQEIYSRNTYKKGELSQLTQGKTTQRLKFMTEAVKETELAAELESETENSSEAEGITVIVGDEEKVSETEGSVTGAGETAPSETSSRKTVVETSESINLKNQLIGVLPGIMPPGQTSSELIASADRLAAMYDYDAAVELLENCASYEQDTAMQAAVEGYKAGKAACVEYPIDQITHVFFHTLIKDPEKAFDGDQYEAGYNQYMVTIDEFNSIIQQMYEKGYVMVTLEDMAPKVVNEDGTTSITEGKILLPKGKIPFVLSQDDVSYYHYMDGDGYAQKLIIDENGDVKNTYVEDDGSISVGDYDMVPLIDTFVDKHPDFSYRGAKGYVALTGYDGILGYRTDICYKTRENLTSYQAQFFQENPDFDQADYERECEESKKVAAAMKEDGWLFASHTWGHVGLGEGSTTIEQFKTDTDKWEERVEPLIGETDTIIYAFGGDIGGAADYSGQRFDYLKSKGFDYFCGVDSATYWVQLRDNYLRQARRNIDGYRMFYNPDMLSDLFDVEQAWDEKRPAYVPPI